MTRRLACALALAALVPSAVPAQGIDIIEGHRNRGGTINYAPRPAAFTVEAVDPYARIVRLRAHDGTTVDVRVPERGPQIDTLTPGDEVRVDFFLPREGDERPTAATIWRLP